MVVESKPGLGTTFHVYLPASHKEDIPERGVEKRPAAEKGRILVMEDEEMLRNLIGKMVRRLGYDVELVKHGGQAIFSYRKAMEAGRPFDAVILDLTVQGGMGGEEAAWKLQEMDPEVKAIVSSGYSDDPVMTNWRQYGFFGVMSKPYQAEDLRQVLERLWVGERG
jgi:DNA-binding NtrC family response regulator